jgi:LysM repeat protein
VYRGQRLGSIAKRYNVSVDAICAANGIKRKDPIQPGQKLIIPSRDDKDGSEARKHRQSEPKERPSKNSTPDEKKEAAPRAKKRASAPGDPKMHTVYRGQRLGSIAKRYNVSVDAICTASGIKKKDPIKPGQKLWIPGKNDPDGSHARLMRVEGRGTDGSPRVQRKDDPGRSWKKYEKAPWRRGFVTLIGHSEEWKGYIIGPGDIVLDGARRAISRVCTAPSNRQLVDARLVRLLAEVSDTFGGRPLRIISGYRSTSYVKGSKHKVGRAVDFRIPGIPNEVLRDYLRSFDRVGVGYYPNSTFVHLDVRGYSAYWVDYAGPGEAPRLRTPKSDRSAKR